MNFFIKYHLESSKKNIVVKNIKDISTDYNKDILLAFDNRANKLLKHFSSLEKEFFLIGDAVIEKNYDLGTILLKKSIDSDINAIKNIGGFYYLIVLNKTENSLAVYNSLFGILPVYFTSIGGYLYISSSVILLSNTTGKKEINKRFILENVLFNYQLFNETSITDIKLLPSNHYLIIKNDNYKISRHTSIEEYFPDNFNPKIEINMIADNFINSVDKYLPDNFYFNALTGGFDGRTLTACGLFKNKNFNTYSFGSQASKDVLIAKELSEAAKIRFREIALDKDYIKDYSLNCGIEFIENAEGNGSFSRAHYLYAAKELSNESEFIITGNFGSEVFRALHVAGVVVNKNLHNMFTASNINEAITFLRQAPELDWLNKDNFALEFESILEDLKSLPCFDSRHSDLDQNKRFYVFVFEEMFRKYFGAEIKNQFKYLSNRSPFLDFNFLVSLFESRFAGIHSNFFEHNPLKRYKGQLFYSNVLKKTYPDFLNALTDKGYRPKDLLNPVGKLLITKGYFVKKLKNKNNTGDPYSVNSAFAHNNSYFKNLSIKDEIFNANKIRSNFSTIKERDTFFIVLSQNYWINKLLNSSN